MYLEKGATVIICSRKDERINTAVE
ncbi:MAG: hypothetical protein MRY83_09435, partial [Flavobacteriales bacterium]|nr:hypothetical protein [Flavobacteriales bacterium]